MPPVGKAPNVTNGRRLHACNEEQRRQAVAARLDRVRSAVTRQVISFVSAHVNVHAVFQAEASGQLLDLGSALFRHQAKGKPSLVGIGRQQRRQLRQRVASGSGIALRGRPPGFHEGQRGAGSGQGPRKAAQ